MSIVNVAAIKPSIYTMISSVLHRLSMLRVMELLIIIGFLVIEAVAVSAGVAGGYWGGELGAYFGDVVGDEVNNIL